MKLTDKHIELIAKTTIDFLEKERKRQQEAKIDRRLRNTKLLIRNYRNFKKHCESIPEELKALDQSLDLDVLGNDELAVESIKKSKERTLAIVKFIDKMLLVYKVMCEQSDKPEDKRRYFAVYHMYISDEKMTVEKIATCQNTDERTVYRDFDNACKTLSALMFGVDSIRFFD